MRKTQLLTATAISLILGAAAASAGGQALAATTISTATTAPVKTSTAGDLTVDTAGSITLTSGTAITVDSDNMVTLNGPVTMAQSAADSTGILITDIAGRAHSGLTVAANITVSDNYTATDTVNADGTPDGPYADTATRYGIHSVGATPYNGNVAIYSGVIDVEGGNAYGVRFENNINGTFTAKGSVVMDGDNNTAIALDNGATGRVYLSGSAAVHGQGSKVVTLKGDFGDAVVIDGTFQSSGYATTSPASDANLVQLLATPSDLYQSGSAVTIAGNVAKGVILDASPVTDSTNASTDQDGDGIADSAQLTGSIATYGTAPALLVGSTTGDIAIGGQVFSSDVVNAPAVAYGLDVRGAITGSGIYQGMTGTAMQIGGTGHAVAIANGMRVKGVVQGLASGSTATALSFLSGASTPLLDVNGTLNATATSSTTADTTVTPTTYTTVAAAADAVVIGAGANLPKINVGTGAGIYAAGMGSTSTATAITDQSDTLTSINNSNIISATITASDDNVDGTADTVLHRAVAIDAHGNTVGLAITQTDTALTDDTVAAPYILGDILLGSGNDSISASGGIISGDVAFGAGANSLALTNAASYIGKMTDIGGTLAVDLGKGSLSLLSGSSLNMTTLHVGAESAITTTLDTTTPTIAPLNATGAAVFDDGATLNLKLSSVIVTANSYAVLKAGSIDLGNLATTDLSGKVPYIYHADLALNTAKTELDANFRLKTQTEANFSPSEYAAFLPVLKASQIDPLAQNALVSQTDKSGFDRVFEQYLPDYSGENLIDLSLGSQSINRSLSSLTLVPDNDGGQYWLQEYGYHTTRDYGATAGFKSTGFSFAGGRETRLTDNNMLGVYLSYTSSSPLDSFAIAKEDMVNSDLTVGGYWRVRDGAFKGWAHAGGGFTQFKTTRQLLATAGSQTVNDVALAKWSGLSYSAGAGASVDYKAGWLGVTPQIFADFYGLNEQKHTETGGGDGFDLTIDKRDGHVFSSTAMVNFNYNKLFVKPEFWVGYKQNISATIPDTVAMFKNGDPFTLIGGDMKGGGPVAGFRISADNQWSYFSLEGDYEKQDIYTNYSVSLRTRFQF